MTDQTTPKAQCRSCGATFTVGVSGISPGHNGKAVDLCDTCAHVIRGPGRGYAFADPEVIRRIIKRLGLL